MKLIINLSIIIFISNNILSQDLSFKSKRNARKTLKTMIKDDQKYRLLMDPNQKNHSLWKLQNNLDSINRNKFTDLIKNYGYPAGKRINGSEYSYIFALHFTSPKDFTFFLPIFNSELKKGNMPPIEYANWYDRSQKTMGQPLYFGQYTNDKFYGEERNLYNIHRKEIGLAPLK